MCIVSSAVKDVLIRRRVKATVRRRIRREVEQHVRDNALPAARPERRALDR